VKDIVKIEIGWPAQVEADKAAMLVSPYVHGVSGRGRLGHRDVPLGQGEAFQNF
jgi:hypothetical protein